MYKIFIKPILFLFPPEFIHHFTEKLLRFSLYIPAKHFFLRKIYSVEKPKLEKEVFGLKFPNPVGLAAGFDKNATMFDALASFGFGFIEIGTVTPEPQQGNPKPRMFRLKEDDALINRMGFNNDGAEVIVKRLKKRKTDIIIGGNIGKNKTTPNENAIDDYEKCFEALFGVVDYFVVNVSSPNTPNLRELQEKEPLKKILFHLQQLNSEKPKRKPILLKIAPDLTNEQLDDIIEIVKETHIDGVVATNTTISRENLKSHPDTIGTNIKSIGAGGLSGKPLASRSTEVINYLSEKSGKAFPIIGVGGIHSPEDAIDKLKAGADLVQVFTGFVYEGPGLVKKINKQILKEMSLTVF
ncbi:MAG: dihydroorotate dehydrogenase (quinone) [Flavobacteriales bacterium]|nr:MAG: dihydroorotate dehydrogenase (quinone) [Flavobacteriales bacterium]